MTEKDRAADAADPDHCAICGRSVGIIDGKLRHKKGSSPTHMPVTLGETIRPRNREDDRELTERDKAANAAARFLPYDPQDGETEALPCIEVGGVQVYAYVKDGVLRISAHLEEADEKVFDLYEDDGAGDNVPVVVQVGCFLVAACSCWGST